VVAYKGRPYAITCRHVFQDFDEGQLTIFGAVFPVKGAHPARVKSVCYPNSPKASAVDTDVTDFCVVEFEEAVTPDFFNGSSYPLNEQTICSSVTGDRLMIFGAVKERTLIDPPNIRVEFCRLEASDKGPSADPPLGGDSFRARSLANILSSKPSGVISLPASGSVSFSNQ
jgi:hypothetical protein